MTVWRRWCWSSRMSSKIRDLVRRYLERDGNVVLSTASGAEAIAMAADARPDLVVLDLGLPDVPGAEVAREIRAVADIPIVMLTARSDEARQNRWAGAREPMTT